MTDNDFADPWGLPPTADDDDVATDAPAEPPPPAEPMTEPTPASPEPPAPSPEPVTAEEPEPSPTEPAPADEPPGGAITADEPAAEDEPAADEAADAESDGPPPASSGPYSQVLAAASGLFGRSTTPPPQEPVEVPGAVEADAAPIEDAIDVVVGEEEPAEPEMVDEVTEPVDVVVEVATDAADSTDDASDDEVDEVLSSLGADLDDVDTEVEAPSADGVDVELEEPSETVSVEQIAAMASQLEVETPEPFEVSFTTEDDDVDVDLDVDVEAENGIDIEKSLSGLEGDEPEISIDMDSAPSVFEELSDAMDESDDEDSDGSLPGGFDVGAVFHSAQDASQEQSEDTDAAVGDEIMDDVAGGIALEAAHEEAVDEPPAESEPTDGADPFAAIDSDEVAEESDPFAASPSAEMGDETEPTAADEADESIAASGEPADDTPVVADESLDGGFGAAAAAATGVVAAAATADQEDPGPSRFVDSGEVEWGARWHESAQGWVEDTSGQATWRPIVTTASTLSEWEVDTYLGIVVGDSPVSTGAPMDTAMALSRQHAIRVMVDEALSRGAHAVIGVQLGVADVGSIPLATATGTAVTLKPGDG